MSLISQKDRELVINALSFYQVNKENDLTENQKMELNALINWIRLEHSKHEN